MLSLSSGSKRKYVPTPTPSSSKALTNPKKSIAPVASNAYSPFRLEALYACAAPVGFSSCPYRGAIRGPFGNRQMEFSSLWIGDSANLSRHQ